MKIVPLLQNLSYLNPLLHTSSCKILENIMKNGTFAPQEQMFHFPQYFQNC